MRKLAYGSVVCAALLATACGNAGNDDAIAASENGLSTPSGQAVTFTIEGDFESTGSMTDDFLKSSAREQLKYALPQLHARRAAAQLLSGNRIFDRFEVTTEGFTQRIRYVAHVNGIWTGPLPAADEAIELVLPRTRSSLARADHAACAPGLGGDMSRLTHFPLHFDPKAEGCAMSSAETLPARVTVAPRFDPEVTTDKSPEYASIWADQKLRVVVFFDKDKRTAAWTDAASTDEGMVAFRAHLDALDAKLGVAQRTDTPYTPFANTVQNVVVTHKATLADGREIQVDSILLDPQVSTMAASYPQLTAGAPVDVVIKNASPFAPQSMDPLVAVVVNGSAGTEHPALLVANSRYSYEFGIPLEPTPGLSRFRNTIQYGGNVPYAVQAQLTKTVIDALEGQSKSYDALLTDLQHVNANLLPIVVGEHANQ